MYFSNLFKYTWNYFFHKGKGISTDKDSYRFSKIKVIILFWMF